MTRVLLQLSSSNETNITTICQSVLKKIISYIYKKYYLLSSIRRIMNDDGTIYINLYIIKKIKT